MTESKTTTAEWVSKNWHFIVFFLGMFITWGTVTEKVNTLGTQVTTINIQMNTLTASVGKLEGKVDVILKNQ